MSSFIFDIDGTLRNFEKEPDIDPNLVTYLTISQTKHQNIVVTGRTVANLNIFLNEIRCDVDMFSKIYCEDGLVSFDNGNITFLINDDDLSQLNNVRTHVNEIINTDNIYSASHPEQHLVGDGVIVVQEASEDMPFMNYLTSYIVRNNFDNLAINHLTHNRVAVSIKAVNKCSAIKNSKINLQECYYFCDEKNDLPLAQLINVSGGKVICPSNAIDGLKMIADYVSAKPYSFGVVDYLSKIL